MKKFLRYFFAFSLLACVATVTLLLTADDTPPSTDTTSASEETLFLNVEKQIDLVQGQTKQLYYYVNFSDATLTLSQTNQQIVLFNEGFLIRALEVGQTTCTICATFGQQVASEEFVINVVARQVTFTCDQTTFASGKKADSSYQTYALVLEANYDFNSSSLLLSDQVAITNTFFITNKKCVLDFYLTQEGAFEISLDGFCFEGNATAYLSQIQILVNNQNFNNTSLTLYFLPQNTSLAHEDGFFDYATLAATHEKMNFLVENHEVAILNYGTLQAVGVGQTNVTALATDGSGQQTSFLLNVLPVNATSCTFEESIKVDKGQGFVIGCSAFLPSYATVCNVTFECDEQIVFENGQFFASDSGIIDVFLNGSLVGQVEVNINRPLLTATNYVVTITQSAGILVDLQNHTITCSRVGAFAPMRLYLTSNGVAVDATVAITQGNSTAVLDGTLLTLNIVNNSTMRVANQSGSFYVDFDIIVLE